MQKNHFVFLKKLKNPESAQLWCTQCTIFVYVLPVAKRMMVAVVH